jgi:uncharacterized protein
MFVMFSEPAPGFLSKARLYFPAHRARLEEFHGRGGLLGAVHWRTAGRKLHGPIHHAEAAEEFVTDDPVRRQRRGRPLAHPGMGRRLQLIRDSHAVLGAATDENGSAC